MNCKKLLLIVIVVGMLSTLFDLTTKMVAFAALSDKIVFNDLLGGNYLLSVKSSYLLSILSFICGLITLSIGRLYLTGLCLRTFAIGLGFILGALIQAFESIIFPVIDFIPVHSYLLFDFAHGHRWCYANFADFYKPLGIILMFLGTLDLIKEAIPKSIIVRFTAS